jgi:hypothetical protein
MHAAKQGTAKRSASPRKPNSRVRKTFTTPARSLHRVSLLGRIQLVRDDQGPAQARLEECV